MEFVDRNVCNKNSGGLRGKQMAPHLVFFWIVCHGVEQVDIWQGKQGKVLSKSCFQTYLRLKLQLDKMQKTQDKTA